MLIGEQHHKSVNTDTEPTCRGQPILKRPDVILIDWVSLVVTGIARRSLGLESRTLIERIVQLRERVRVFCASDKELKPFGDVWFVPVHS